MSHLKTHLNASQLLTSSLKKNSHLLSKKSYL